MSLDSLTKQSSAPRTPFRLSAPTLGATTLRIGLMLVINTAMLAAIALPIQPYARPVGPATPWFAGAAMFSWQVIMVLQALAFFRWVDGRQLPARSFWFVVTSCGPWRTMAPGLRLW